jgi:DNA-binding SARP family transcriptional activator
MSQLNVTLFGRLHIESQGRVLELSDSHKAQELFCFLLLHRRRSYPRESLAGMLWEHCTTAQSKAYLRKALWQLQHALAELPETSALLLAEPEWIQINPESELSVDVELFEQVHRATTGRGGRELDEQMMNLIGHAIDIYKGDLLENWYLDWCLYERERLQQIFLILLDKSMDYFELHGRYETGIDYGSRILGIDRARENTHRRLMRLYYLGGDRTGALRQFQRCALALREELNAEPSKRTTSLYEQIRNDQAVTPPSSREEDDPTPCTDSTLRIDVTSPTESTLPVELYTTPLGERIARLQDLHHLLVNIQAEISRELNAMQSGLPRP